ncbi:RrF2 family transcriptional regulator [Pseudaquidulcibacter saccharophilus]|uniref:RrF2 family transcriptional regulator n=1 Tax=Pseudaquidulcibacter saccharophilus TaxID=2831900 RepID=UPI001EFF4361|nr:Rrf2 family transcriptional regulator [Pseudaquidulcibacter saccharophilus]
MRLTRYTDYAIRVLLFLAPRTELTTVGEIADFYKISQNHLVKIVQDLVKYEYIESFKGRGGGMRLSKAPDKINLGEFVKRFEPDMRLIDCIGCKIAGSCSLPLPLHKALAAFVKELNQYSLQDIIDSSENLSTIFGNGAK